MRILFINNYYPPYEIGGYEQLCRDVAARLAARGHQIQVLTSNYGATRRSSLTEPNVQRALHLQPNYRSNLSAALQFFLTRRSDEAHDLQCLRRLARQFRPEAILIWNLEYLPASIAVAAEAIQGTGVAYWIAGWSPAAPDEYWNYWRHSAKRPIMNLLKRPITNLAISMMRAEGKPERPQMKHTAVVSEYMRQKGIAEGVLPPDTQVIYNGVEVNLFYRPIRSGANGDLTVLQAGRVSTDKGVHTTVEAVGRLVRECNFDHIHLNIAGAGPADYLARLQQIVAQWAIGDKVSFLGRLSREDMPDLMSRCHVLVLPTESQEPFARVVLEAMASGLVAIGTLTGGTGEIIQHETTGLTFPAGDSQALARQIERVAADSQLRTRLAARGQKWVLEKFDLDQMVAHVERLLQEACADGHVHDGLEVVE